MAMVTSKEKIIIIIPLSLSDLKYWIELSSMMNNSKENMSNQTGISLNPFINVMIKKAMIPKVPSVKKIFLIELIPFAFVNCILSYDVTLKIGEVI